MGAVADWLVPPTDRYLVSKQAIVTGRRPFFYSYDVATGKVVKIPRIFSSGRAEKHVETFAASPDGQWLAFIGSGGESASHSLPPPAPPRQHTC